MPLPLEDNFTDVIGKAQRGLGLDDDTLARRAGINPAQVRQLKTGAFDAAALRALAPPLELSPTALVAMARGEWAPPEITFPDGFAADTTAFDDMTVNAYLVWDPQTRQAAAIDTGASCEGLLRIAQQRALQIELILLTHTHEDHIADLERLVSATGADVWLSNRGRLPGAQTFPEGFVFQLGQLVIRTLHTYGHAADGATYVVEGLAHPLAIVGDSLFASSMGGSRDDYAAARRNNVEKILRLPPATVLAPGHGPLTTVGEELRHNPFFAA
jgi:hydroxyacylglutathione hydrolase